MNEKGEEDPERNESKVMNTTGHFSQQSDSMAFEDEEDNNFVILRKDNMDITGPIRRLNQSFHDYSEVSYCFGMVRRIKKTKN